MKFNEKAFRQLADETVTAVTRLGTTSHAVLDRYPRFTDLLVNHLKSIDACFNLEECLDWVNTLEHDPPIICTSSRYMCLCCFHHRQDVKAFQKLIQEHPSLLCPTGTHGSSEPV